MFKLPRLLLAATLLAVAAPPALAAEEAVLFATTQNFAQPDGSLRFLATLSIGSTRGGPVRDLVTSDGGGTGLSIGSTTYPRWSPDKTQVLFRGSDPALANQMDSLFVIPAAGGTPVNITAAVPVNGLLTGGSFSPNGKSVAFTGEIDPGNLTSWNDEIFTVTVNGGSWRQLTRDGDGKTKFFPVYSPDGNSIAYIWNGDTGYRLAVVPASGGRVKVLDTNIRKGSTLSWSPDGKKIAYARFSADGTYTDVMTVDVREGKRRNLTNGAFKGSRQVTWSGSVMYPTYSPRGDRIAFTYVPGLRDGSETGELWTISSGGGDARRLATKVDPYAYETGIGWSADGASIVFTDASTPSSNPDFNAFDTSLASVFTSGGPVFVLAGPYPGSVSSAALR